jgi:hypothetical protein
MAAATSTSVGASAPRATRPSAFRATSAAATHLPVLRQRPSGTSVYKMATRTVAKKVTCSDGSAQPPQLVWMTTPNGRGRCANSPTMLAAGKTTTLAKMRKTTRCRKRLSASSASTSTNDNPLMTHQELRAASARQATTSPGAWSPASHLTTVSSATVTATAGPRMPLPKTMIASATSTTAASSHPTPLVCRWYGNGGGSPDGRRRPTGRSVPGTIGGTIGGPLIWVDWSAGTSMVLPTGSAQPGTRTFRAGFRLVKARNPLQVQPPASRTSRVRRPLAPPTAGPGRRIVSACDGGGRPWKPRPVGSTASSSAGRSLSRLRSASRCG